MARKNAIGFMDINIYVQFVPSIYSDVEALAIIRPLHEQTCNHNTINLCNVARLETRYSPLTMISQIHID